MPLPAHSPQYRVRSPVRRRAEKRPVWDSFRPFAAAAGLGAAFLTVGGLTALDFDRAFVIFHRVFFPGKENWIFDWQTDPIILFLPQDFFRNCAILILVLLLVWCGALIAADVWAKKGGR